MKLVPPQTEEINIPLILSIETSTSVCSVALHKDANLIGLSEIHLEKSHSSVINKLIRELLENCGVTLKELNAIAVSKGPGSYTGLRIGVSSAKGFCFALDIPLIGISTLQALALKAGRFISHENILIVPMLDARRMEVYHAVFDSMNTCIRQPAAEIIHADIYNEYLDSHTLLLIGDGVDKSIPVFKENKKVKIATGIFPDAAAIGRLAYEKFISRNFEDIAYFEPFYLKDFIGKMLMG